MIVEKTLNIRIVFLGILFYTIPLWTMAQSVDLRLTNANTTVRSIIFRGNVQFSSKTLHPIIALKAPTFKDYFPKWLKRLTFAENRTFKFNPFELQKDVIRLKKHYQRNGFLNVEVDYIASLTQNERLNVIDIIFVIKEGVPIQLEEAQVLSIDGRKLERVLAADIQESWLDFYKGLNFSTQKGYSELQIAQMGQQINSWLKDQGYAFAKTTIRAEIDSLYNRANLFVVADIGKRTTFGGILIEGLEHTDTDVVKNLLTFKTGDPFSVQKLIESRKRIFEASQFRAVFYEVLPENDTDEARANVKFTIYEAKTKAFRLRTGFNLDGNSDVANGLSLNLLGQASWENKNMFRRGHSFSAILSANGQFGLKTVDNKILSPIYAKQSIILPYTYPNFFHPKWSLSFIPQAEQTNTSELSSLHPGNNFGDIKTTSLSLVNALIYQYDRFRSASLNRTFRRNRDQIDLKETENDYDLSYTDHHSSVGGTVGWIDNFLNRQNGILCSPSVTITDSYFRSQDAVQAVSKNGVTITDSYFRTLGDTLETKPFPHIKIEANLTAYWQPFKQWKSALSGLGLATRFFVGQTWAKGLEDLAVDDIRWNRIAYFAGGSNDVRGWGNNFLGEKRIVKKIDESNGDIFYEYKPEGGLAKMVANVELRYTLARLPAMQLTAFRDKGMLFADKVDIKSFRENGFYGMGFGMRFSSNWGVARLEFARKMNPNTFDLQKPDGSACGTFGLIQGCGKWRMDLSFSQAF